MSLVEPGTGMEIPSVERMVRCLRSSTSSTVYVDAIIGAPAGHDPDLRFGLAVAVHAALALLQAGGVPWQVVVDDGVENMFLEVDALAETVRRTRAPCEECSASSAMRASRSAGCKQPGH